MRRACRPRWLLWWIVVCAVSGGLWSAICLGAGARWRRVTVAVGELRDRIAAVLYTRHAHALGYADEPWDNVDHEPWLEDADAVIAELGVGTCVNGCRKRDPVFDALGFESREG
jgi:hypothetical protein